MIRATFLGQIVPTAGGYSAEFPDVPDCTVSAPTVVEAIVTGQRALRDHIALAVRSDAEIPLPFTEKIERDEGIVSTFAAEVDLPEQIVTVPLRIERDLLDRVDSLDVGRSAFINEAIREKLVSTGQATQAEGWLFSREEKDDQFATRLKPISEAVGPSKSPH